MAYRRRQRSGFGALTGYLPARSTQRAPFPSLAGGGINTRSRAVLQGAMAGRPLVQRQQPVAQQRPAPAPPAAADGGIGAALAKLKAQTQDTSLAPKNVSYNYATDPLLQQVQALGTQSRQGAESQALALKKQTAIDYGDEALARSLGDESTALAAKNNPNSVRAQLQKSYQDAQTDLENQYNEQNLFYGGARIKGLGDLAKTLTNEQAQAAGEQQKTLSGIEEQRLAAIRAADAADLQAQQEAYNRALQEAMESGYAPEDVDWESILRDMFVDEGPIDEGTTKTASGIPIYRPTSMAPYDISRAGARAAGTAPVARMATPAASPGILRMIRTPPPLRVKPAAQAARAGGGGGGGGGGGRAGGGGGAGGARGGGGGAKGGGKSKGKGKGKGKK